MLDMISLLLMEIDKLYWILYLNLFVKLKRLL